MIELVGYLKKTKKENCLAIDLSVELMESVEKLPGNHNLDAFYYHLFVYVSDIHELAEGDKVAIPVYAVDPDAEKPAEEESKTENFIVHDNNRGSSGANVNSYPTLQRTASSPKEALALAKKEFPEDDTEPVIIFQKTSMVYKTKMVYTMEIRPIKQSSLDGFGGVPDGTD